MTQYVIALRLFSIYNLYYSFQFFKISEILFTTDGFLQRPIFNFPKEIIYVKIFLLFKILFCAITFLKPLQIYSWLIYFIFHILLLSFATLGISIAFPTITFLCIAIIFANLAIRHQNNSLLDKAVSFGYFGLALTHFTAGLTKVFIVNSTWITGQAFKEIIFHTVWRQGWYIKYLVHVPDSFFIILNYMTVLIELAVIFMFSKKSKYIACFFILFLHFGALLFFYLEEISLCNILSVFILLALFRLHKMKVRDV